MWADTVWEENRQYIPYGINYTSYSFFDTAGKISSTTPGIGLTCATFIMQLFNDYSLPLVDIESWETRPEDATWQKRIVEALNNNYHVSKEHIDEQIKFIGIAPRFKPEEVAASAAYFSKSQIVFSSAEEWGLNLLNFMRFDGKLKPG